MDSVGGADRVAQHLRVLVCPHELIVGGSQINAIDLAARMRDRGHTVRIYAPPGPLVQRIEGHGLPYRAAPPHKARALRVRALFALAREIHRFAPDIVHTYESSPAIASAAVSSISTHRSVATMLSMDVPDFIPENVPLLVGTTALLHAQSARSGPVQLLEPPVDTDYDSPRDAAAARADLNIAPDQFVVGVVGRLSKEHEKARGVIRAIQRLDQSDLSSAVTLVVAGTGDEEAEVREAAASTRNPMLTVRVEGNVDDPRPIYAAADVIFGMGGSALRAMSHARPLIVQGADGFWETLTPRSVDRFLMQGFFGNGPSGAAPFEQLVAELMRDQHQREVLGRFGRELVLTRFAIDQAARMLEATYFEELRTPRSRREQAFAVSYALARYARFRVAVRLPLLRRLYRWASGRRG
ncbi:glycosyltransferase family 4 protein [Microbacterium sp. zg.Y909]|uniref:glycosyltransferase family 4 protein n=1 Tax=Microbacterium sp. zg.Y909 TaxID=2969413 RepID=UPI00214BA96B|nr:glycosyltransferase family 4 protein [Microbacterium sp. zg.Y909]MCR2823921.1 glycosyltransferase family 4 protein [Microbacterium sp. zg.Y909]